MPAHDGTRRVIRRADALFLGHLPSTPEVHSHHVIQCSIALDGELRVTVDPLRSESLGSVLIASDQPHSVSAQGLVGHFYVSPESSAGAGLSGLLSGRPFIEIEPCLPSPARDALSQAWTDEAHLEPCLDLLIGSVLKAAPAPAPGGDPRVVAALRILHREDGSPTLTELSRRVELSPDRLRHLFKRDTGLTVRRYRRWLRLVRSLDALQESPSVTAAAARAQFADAAHLSRAFRESFSFSPRAFLRDSRFVQASRSQSR